ncbi:MAG: 2-dehydropantoate 2-reductase [Firmicutes bacterium]|nr:2-dehydropantoate 2-reductase [Bacillota bacterium]MBR6799275.1 2-dehydropantoate 2-reductase [Bacillota bacterium]
MIKTIGVIGAGSVGSALISKLYKDDPDNIYIVADEERAARMSEKGINVNGTTIYPHIYSDKSQNIKLDLIIVAVKTYSLEDAMESMAGLISDETIILPIQNGIVATDKLQEKFPNNRVFHGIVLRTDAHRMGRRVYFSTLGEMQIGYAENKIVAPEVQAVHDRLKELDINVNIYEDMKRAQWRKWMLNVGAGQAAVETHVECGFFGQVNEIKEIMELCMDEVVQVGQAEGVNLTYEDRDEIIDILINFPPDKKMSMLQDIEAGRSIEIDEYAGTVIKLGEKHGIPTPVNKVLYLAITAREKVNAMRR